MVSSIDFVRRKDITIKAAREAGRFLFKRFGSIKRIKIKGDRDLVTDIDIAAETIIKNHILRKFPGDNIISEESSVKQDAEFTPLEISNTKQGSSKFLTGFSWIIDPLDGTHNYIHNIDIFGVSIALAYKNQVFLGVIYMPKDDEFYFAQKNKGAYLNGKRLYVSKRNIKNATMIFDSSIRYQKRKMLRGLGRLIDRVFNVRMFGSTVRGLSYIAEGRAELEIEYNDKLWDFAAGLLLVEEAGGRVTDLSGKKWNIKTKGYIASNGKIHNEILRLIK